MKLVSVILCGGEGSRLWPLSRQMQPKPFIRLDDGHSLLQKAFIHGTHKLPVDEVMVVSNAQYVEATRTEIDEINTQHIPVTYIYEPKGRNTAPAITAAAVYCEKKYGDKVMMLVLPSDHLIDQQDHFAQVLIDTMPMAEGRALVTFGVKPTVAETGYGYIEYQGNKILRFIEKPSLENAEGHLEDGNFLWNSAIMMFTTEAFFEHMKAHCGQLLADVEACVTSADVEHIVHKDTKADQVMLPVDFENIPENSLEYALLEKDTNLLVVPIDVGWSDVGSWTSFRNLFAADNEGNRSVGETVLLKTKNCTVYGHDRLVGIIGMENTIIVDTKDALLVAKDQSVDDLRELYQRLKHRGHEAHKEHLTVHRRWGSYTLIEAGKGYAIKRMEVKPRGRQDLQMHHHRNEHWVVVSGMGRVTNEKDTYFISVNQSTFIPAGNRHRLENPGQVPLVIIETQTGDYISESDIVRYED